MSSLVVPDKEPAMSQVPKLATDGKNWIVYRIRFESAIASHGLRGHLDGTSPKPVTSGAEAPTTTTATPAAGSGSGGTTTTKPSGKSSTTSTDDTTTTPPAGGSTTAADSAKQLADWALKEDRARDLLQRTIPDSALIQIYHEPTTAAAWKVICNVFESKSAGVKAEYHEDLQNTRLVMLSNDEWRAIIIKSLSNHDHYFHWVKMVTSAALLNGTTSPINPDRLLTTLLDEYDSEQRAKASRSQTEKSSGSSKDAAYVANGGSRGGSSSKRSKGGKNGWKNSAGGTSGSGFRCYNCDGKGHKSAQCPSPSDLSDDDDDDSWWVEDRLAEDQPDAENEGESDEAFSSVPMPARDTSTTYAEEPAADTGPAPSTPLDVQEIAQAAAEPGAAAASVECYDSGTTRHMCPHKERFVTLTPIEPRPISAASKHTFHAIGVGELFLKVPNGDSISNIRLQDVLYAPDIAMTLVSIGRIDDAGGVVTFGGGACEIRDADGKLLGRIPKERGLYRVIQDGDAYAYAAVEMVSIEDLHRRMGHIAPAAAKKLVDEGRISGLRIDPLSPTDFECDSCTAAKMQRKPVPKKRGTPLAENLGDVMHSDLCGKLAVESRGGRAYFMTMIDDATRYAEVFLLKNKSETFETYK